MKEIFLEKKKQLVTLQPHWKLCEYTDKTYSNLIKQWVIVQPHMEELCLKIPIKHKS